MFERPKSGSTAVLVDPSDQSEAAAREELRSLATAAGAETVAVIASRRPQPDPRFFIGSGKLEELKQTVEEHQADLVLFGEALSPSQERNLEKALGVRVVDRTGLILDIFAQRAQTFEGKLQVELAQLRHLSTRLVRGWTHLERQKGGIGLRGPGETQLETDKRLLGRRITQIQRRLDKVEKQRSQGRSARRRSDLPVVGLVGYTNAGKSTLFNVLTGSDVLVADQLFATLDPTFRRIDVRGKNPVVLVDTVGFIRNLPHELVAAFRSTLRESTDADLLLHVIDVADERLAETVAEVERVLEEIGADSVPRILVFNKIDKIEGSEPHVERDERGQVRQLWLSARASLGLDLLREALGEFLVGKLQRSRLRLGPAEGKIRSRLYELDLVRAEQEDADGGWWLDVEIPKPGEDMSEDADRGDGFLRLVATRVLAGTAE